MFDGDDGDFGPTFETPPATPLTSPSGQGRMIPQPQIERPVAPPQPMPPSMAMALARPGPMPPRGIFSNGDPALGAIQEIQPAHMLGLSVLLPAVGAVAGAKFAGGVYGGLGGATGVGSLINLYRAAKNVVQGTSEGDKEALISGTYALIGFVGAGWLLYKGITSKGGKAKMNRGEEDNEDEDEDEDDEEDEYVANASKLRGVR